MHDSPWTQEEVPVREVCPPLVHLAVVICAGAPEGCPQQSAARSGEW